MRLIDVKQVRAGARFESALRDADGRVLLAPGEAVTEGMLETMRASGVKGTVETKAPLHTVPAAPTSPPPRSREHARLHWTTLARLRREAEDVVAHRRARWERLDLRIEPVTPRAAQGVVDPSKDPSPLRDQHELDAARSERIGLLRRVFARLVAGEWAGAGALNELVDELLDERLRRARGYSAVALGSGDRGPGLVEHCFTTGALCVGLAVELGWARPDVRSAGLAGLLADAGLALLPAPLRLLERPLSEVETNQMRRHVGYSAALAERIRGGGPDQALPESVQLALYQHHERDDGSGYPERLRAHAIHDLARIVAVADVFAGLTAQRAHRPPLAPPTAIAEVARQANAGVLNRQAAAALIQLCGIYPPGSRLRLSTGDEALVVRAGGTWRLDRPVVRLIQPGGHAGAWIAGRAIDLAACEEDDVSVVALAA